MSTSRALLALSLLVAFTIQCGLLPAGINIAEPNRSDINQAMESTFQALTAQAVSAPAATPQLAATPSNAVMTGAISGQLRCPVDSLPAMYVTAYQVGSQNYRYIITAPGQDTYEIDGLAPGNYQVIAYTVGGAGFPAGRAGGYTQAVPCGLGANCTDHSLINIEVEAGQTETGIVPDDWYAPRGTFPPFPQQATSGGTATLPTSAAEGGIGGTLMYPASEIPALRIVAFEIGSSSYYYIDTNLGQSSYELDHLPPGSYHVVAYPLPSGGFTGGPPGGYSRMVPCGLQASCTDHTLIDVVVTSGNITTGVDPNDYYAGPGTFPPNPAP